MQTTTALFDARATGSMRPISGKVFMSFDKTFNDATQFFTLDESSLDGGDILQGEGDVIQSWDKYEYTDYSDRIVGLEWSRQEDPVSSVTLATADIELNNFDNFFTPGAGSAINDYILPGRPIRIYSGFGGEDLPVFIGLTEGTPEIDERAKTARFHCIDFMQSLLNRPLEATPLYRNARTDEILSDLLVNAGLLPSQFVLDIGVNVVPYAFFPRGMKLGDAVDDLMTAEQGRFFMDELGTLRFKNRQNYPTVPVAYFDGSSIIDSTPISFDEIINVVQIKLHTLEEQEFQKAYELPQSVLIPAGQSVEIWGEFQDPVTECDTPVYVDSATTSYYATNENPEGTGASLSGIVSLTDTDLYSTLYRMVFENSGSVNAYVTNIELYGVPIKSETEVVVRESDDASVAQYEEHVKEIENDFIQDRDMAVSKALVLLEDYSEYNKAQSVEVKGNPALQVGDMLSIGLTSSEDYIITKITGRLMDHSFKQELGVKQFTRRTYFTLDSSALDSGNELAP